MLAAVRPSPASPSCFFRGVRIGDPQGLRTPAFPQRDRWDVTFRH